MSGDVTIDAWLGGRLSLEQPARGHRVGSDAALLAAAAFGEPKRIVDVGSGVGAVGLAAGLRRPEAQIALVEIDEASAAMAQRNAERNGMAARVQIVVCDVTSAKARRVAGLLDGGADLVLTNPPYYEEPRSQASPDLGRARAHVLPRGTSAESALMAWMRASVALLAPRGRMIIVHRPDRMFEIVSALEGRCGGVTILPVYPRAGAPAHRILIAGTLGTRAPPRIAPGLVLHGADGAMTLEAVAAHRGEAALNWGGD